MGNPFEGVQRDEDVALVLKQFSSMPAGLRWKCRTLPDHDWPEPEDSPGGYKMMGGWWMTRLLVEVWWRENTNFPVLLAEAGSEPLVEGKYGKQPYCVAREDYPEAWLKLAENALAAATDRMCEIRQARNPKWIGPKKNGASHKPSASEELPASPEKVTSDK